MNIIDLQDISKTYEDVIALQNITFSVKKGEAVSIVGPSGSGKTSLLRIIAKLDMPNHGSYQLFGVSQYESINKKTLNSQRESIGMIFQEGYLFDHLSILDNLLLSPRLKKLRQKIELIDEANEVLEMVGILDKKNKYPSELSGGQKQRAAIARALMLNPQIILFDEPTSALDVDAIDGLIEIIIELKKMGKTIIVVTHDVAFAKRCTSRLLFMEKSSIILDEYVDTLNTVQNKRVQQFLSKR